MSARGVLRILEGGKLAWWCPGCKFGHNVRVEGPDAWGFNGNYSHPTFTPSVYHDQSMWIRNEIEDRLVPHRVVICHCFVRDGEIQFLGDCTHALAGQTVKMEPMP